MDTITLRDYQEDISGKCASIVQKYHMCYLAMECRTGKTLTALAAADKIGAKNVLAISKLKALPGIRSDYQSLNPGFNLDVINYESAAKMMDGHYDLIILDEAHSLGAFPRPSSRTKTVKKLCGNLPVIYLSGTPTPESYSQLYHQMWVSAYSPFKAFPNFYKWAKVFVDVKQRHINGYQVNDYSHARKGMIDRFTSHLFIGFTQEDAGFSTGIEEHVWEVMVSGWTQRALAKLRRDRVITFGDHSIVADTPAKLLGKLHQLSCGTIIDENGEHIITDMSKAYAIRDRFNGKRLAIFYVYQSEADLLKKVFPKWTDIPEMFQRSEDADVVFLGQVRSAREGVRLDRADALVFYNLEFSFLSYEQGRNRLCSKERGRTAHVFFPVSHCGMERDILEAVHEKKDFTASYYMKKYGK